MTTTTQQPATLIAQLQEFANYNLWANQTASAWLKAKSPEQLEAMIPSSFPSLKETLVHIWDTEQSWLSHLKGEVPPPPFRLHGYHGTLEGVFEGLLKCSEELHRFTGTLNDEQLNETLHIEIPFVGPVSMERFRILQHVLNHSTYHRGQLATIGRNLGITDAPMTDFMFYLLRVK